MKKILIVNNELGLNGTAKSLLNFVHHINGQVEIDLLILKRQGVLLDMVPENVHFVDFPFFDESVKEKAKSKKIIYKLYSVLSNFGLANLKHKFAVNKIKKITQNWKHEKEYDLAISFQGTHGALNEVVLNKINAKKKICIIHCDILKATGIASGLKNQFKQFDLCLGCSKSVAENFKKKYKGLKNIDYLYNFLNVEEIKNGAKEASEKIKTDRFCFGTVARINEVKKPIRLMKVLKKANKKGLKFEFFWIGDGPLKTQVQDFLTKNKMQNVHLLGAQVNPYKFVKQFDLFVLASKNEAAPIVFAEAMTLSVPVLSTNTCSAKELVGENGFVCKNSSKEIYKAIENLVKNPKLVEDKKEKLKNYKYNNDKIIEKVLQICE